MLYIAKRVAVGVLTVVASSIIVFAVVRVIPGDPLAAAMGSQSFDPQAAESLRELYGLDKPIAEQYVQWVTAIIHGNFGVSFRSRTPVGPELLLRLPRTVFLLIGGIGTAVLIAGPVAIFAARRPGSARDVTATTFSTITLATPAFFLGILLIFVFAVTLGWFPATGYIPPATSFSGFLRSMALPSLTIGLVTAAILVRVLRSSLLDVFGQDYIRAARARGLRDRQVVRDHAIRNAAIPAVTVLGLQVGFLLGGSIVVEVLFSYPGIGLFMINAITARDYPTLQACLLFFAISFVIINLITDLVYSALDPRIRL